MRVYANNFTFFQKDFSELTWGSTEHLIFEKDLEGANVVVGTKFNFPEGFFGANF